MFSRDEMQRAIEDALKSMEGIALELYRRGREEAGEELKEARARNADMRAMLEQVTRERDEWRDKFLALNQTAGELCNACGWAFRIPGEPCRCEVVKERDEARAEAERLRTALLEVQTSESAPAWFADGFHDGWKAGAEAMRARCEEIARHACSVIGKLEHTYGIMTQGHIETVSRLILEVDIPEEP